MNEVLMAAEGLARGGNAINAEASSKISRDADEALTLFDKLKHTSVFSRPLNEATERLAAGENRKKVQDDLYGRILEGVRHAYAL